MYPTDCCITASATYTILFSKRIRNKKEVNINMMSEISISLKLKIILFLTVYLTSTRSIYLVHNVEGKTGWKTTLMMGFTSVLFCDGILKLLCHTTVCYWHNFHLWFFDLNFFSPFFFVIIAMYLKGIG